MPKTNKQLNQPRLRVFRFGSARKLLDRLRLIDDRYWEPPNDMFPNSSWDRDWLFRGQRDSTWKLTPSAWRDENKITLLNHIGSRISAAIRSLDADRMAEDWKKFRAKLEYEDDEHLSSQRLADAFSQAFLEVRAVDDFLVEADNKGFSSPGIETILEQRGPHTKSDEFLKDFFLAIKFKTSFFLWSKPVIAFAQHYGIPTRLLDWTENPLVAAFFAAEDAVNFEYNPDNRDKPIPKYIAVFAVHRHFTGDVNAVPTARSTNNYLRSQSGVLLFDASADRYYVEHGRYLDMMQTLLRGTYPSNTEFYFPQKFLLPTSECRELLRLLALEGITRASLMPSLDNVARSVLLRWRIIAETR